MKSFVMLGSLIYVRFTMLKVLEETFVAEGSSTKSTKLFHLESFYITVATYAAKQCCDHDVIG